MRDSGWLKIVTGCCKCRYFFDCCCITDASVALLLNIQRGREQERKVGKSRDFPLKVKKRLIFPLFRKTRKHWKIVLNVMGAKVLEYTGR